jgi:PAS domain S-box-containing protein
MNPRVQEIRNLLYEVSMAIGMSLDLHEMLHTSILTLIRGLNCSAGIVYAIESTDGVETLMHDIHSVPRLSISPDLDRAARDCVNEFALQHQGTTEPVSLLLHRSPITRSLDYLSHFHLAGLPGYGVLVLLKQGSEWDPLVCKALQPVTSKLAYACLACMQQQAVQESERNYREVFNSINEAIFIHETKNGSIIDANETAARMYGYDTKDEILALSIGEMSAHLSPYTQEQAQARMQLAIRGTAQTFEWLGRKKNGMHFPVEVSLRLSEIRGKTRILAVVRDITERKQAEKDMQASLREKDSLLKEIHHRVKNNLQIVSSLLNLQSVRLDNHIAKAALKDTQNRVRSMALIHEHLYRSENLAAVNMSAYLRQLCSQLLRALVAPPSNIQLHLDLAPVHLGIDQAIPCGLLVNELVSNSFKHAFPEGRSGEVRIELQPMDGGSSHRLAVSDNGVGLPANFTTHKLASLGLRLATDLSRQIGGQLKISHIPTTRFEVEFDVTPGKDHGHSANGAVKLPNT